MEKPPYDFEPTNRAKNIRCIIGKITAGIEPIVLFAVDPLGDP